ncbi:class I SAM-dependent methyltransferase [Streptomyces sp. HC44]|uniref:Class I SAM-dependent methyltransferase n=1 Tax=Streptomyces scabichelini TaxID=2711217 RepID=A0A6G4VE25_9ACTN|nr:class I SAM-dependent methyltransferase [Streptomyces scabichelini]NGO12033.1 class I SAM-dependent methyltransferase [Streptomyces scabichelini]
MAKYLGIGGGRTALDIGCGDGALARYLHEHLGYRTTGIDCAPTAVALAADQHADVEGLRFQLLDFATGDLHELPCSSYALITCRLAYKFIGDKPRFLDRVRHLLTPGGMVWVVAEPADRLEGAAIARGLTRTEVEELTTGRPTVHVEDLDRLICFRLDS